MQNAIVSAVMTAGWCYAGYAWAKALRFRAHFAAVPVEVERVPAQFAEFSATLCSTVAKARLVGPGYLIENEGQFTIGGICVNVRVSCDTDQIAAAPEKDAQR